jgi:uncharacterized membrane protein
VDSEVLAAPVDSEKVNENNFQRRRVDSSALPTPVDLEKGNENWATTVSEIINETDFEGDAWIRQRPQPLLTHK